MLLVRGQTVVSHWIYNIRNRRWSGIQSDKFRYRWEYYLVGLYLAYTGFNCWYQLYVLNTCWISSDSLRYRGKPGDRGILGNHVSVGIIYEESRAQDRTTHWLNSKFIPPRNFGLTKVTPMGNPLTIWRLLDKARQNMTIEAKELLTPRMPLCASKSVRTTHTIWYSRENWPSGGLNAVPPFALLISIWL